jgi:hypothetical protein
MKLERKEGVHPCGKERESMRASERERSVSKGELRTSVDVFTLVRYSTPSITNESSAPAEAVAPEPTDDFKMAIAESAGALVGLQCLGRIHGWVRVRLGLGLQSERL